MAETSLFAQRLQAIMERRRLQERILATRRELEEERLRAQRLKRKSLRDRWLMEGTSTPTDDNDHVSSAWESQSRIQELEQDLTSLESQMQQLDNTERHQGRQQPEESVKVLKEAMLASPGGSGEVDGNPSSSPEGRSCNESRFELDPIPPKRPVRVDAKEKLQNGDMAGLGLFGNEYSTDKAEVKRSPENEAGVDLQDHQGSPESASGGKPACRGMEHSEGLSSCQRKLAVEEMVIRDHLGQEVGSMDAVGQTQRSIGKEEPLEDYTDLGNGYKEESRSSPLCNTSSQGEASTANKSQLDDELGSRDGPEGESPTSQDHQSPSKPLQDERGNHYTLRQGVDEELEMGSLTKEATLMGVEVKQLLEQGAKEAAGNAEKLGQKNLTGEKGLQEFCGSEAIVLGQGEERQEPCLEQLQPCLSDEPAAAQETKVPNPLEEARMCLPDQATSAFLTAQVPPTLQDPNSSPQDTKESLLDQIPSSFEETKGSLLDPVISSLSNQSLPTVLDQTPPLQERKESLPASDPSSLQEQPLLDSNPPVPLQDPLSFSMEQKPSSLQGEATAPQEAIQSLLDQIPSPVHEANGKLLAQSTSLPDQVQSSLPGHFAALPEQNPSSLHETERSFQTSSALQDQERSVLETKGHLPDTLPSLTDQVSSLPNQITCQEVGELSSEEITVVLQNQMPIPPEAQILSVPESDIALPGHILSSVVEDKPVLPEETETSVPDQFAPPMQEQKSTFVRDETSALQESGGSLADQIQAPLPSQTSPSLEAKGIPQDQAQPLILEQLPVPLEDQAPSLQGTEESLSKQQNLSAPQEETPILQDQITSPNNISSSAPQDTTTAADALPSASQDSVQPLLEKTAMEENQKVTESEDTSLTSATAVITEEATEVLENLHAEQQPLLKEPTASVAPPDIPVGDPQSKTGISKPHMATSQEAPTYTTTSANTASSCPLPPAVPLQGEGQEQGQNRRKQKSCQCCSVM